MFCNKRFSKKFRKFYWKSCSLENTHFEEHLRTTVSTGPNGISKDDQLLKLKFPNNIELKR